MKSKRLPRAWEPTFQPKSRLFKSTIMGHLKVFQPLTNFIIFICLSPSWTTHLDRQQNPASQFLQSHIMFYNFKISYNSRMSSILCVKHQGVSCFNTDRSMFLIITLPSISDLNYHGQRPCRESLLPSPWLLKGCACLVHATRDWTRNGNVEIEPFFITVLSRHYISKLRAEK